MIDYSWNSTEHCPPCFYGSICQLTTFYYSISLESFLYTSFSTVGVLIVLIFVFALGTVCNFLSIMTFAQATARETGSGIYRLWISIIGQVTLVIITIRLLMIIRKKASRWIDCFVVDYSISALVPLFYSLTVCLAIERIVVAYKHLLFDKQQSRRAAKKLISILMIYHFGLALYKPIHRQLRVESNRIECSYYFQTQSQINFERLINILHLILPILVNFFAPLILIVILIEHKRSLKPTTTFLSRFVDVIRTYKHNLISPLLLVTLTLPHLLITLHFHCISQSKQIIIYLFTYILSLIPFVSTLFIFVFLSPKYREEFSKLYQRRY
ncbi:unnamed protein product [Adineta ricciae]|uniref:G-protein coupled receptors family 1 profile domain-containing protein n=1 Tax=Adineta ricciae TaxID=249248 RepID=A0A815GRK6_ADIRI|nr:unnamed protein product [Adineta ricciae]